METKLFYHLCADGDDAHNFIIRDSDYIAAFNLVGVCAANTQVIVVCFSLEDTHPHFLLYGTYEECLRFKEMFESSYRHYIVQSRKSLDDLVLDMVIYPVRTEDYLMNVATYIVVQATKDGKDVMPFDYKWGSGSLYFRRSPYVPVWQFRDDGSIAGVEQISDFPIHERRTILHSKMSVPDNWLVTNGILLPSNYVDIKLFESIYKTCNCYRTFLVSGRKKDEPILNKIAQVRGVAIEDIEARRLCSTTSKSMFGIADVRRLTATQRVSLALELRKVYHLSLRQLSRIVRLPYSEIQKYVH